MYIITPFLRTIEMWNHLFLMELNLEDKVICDYISLNVFGPYMKIQITPQWFKQGKYLILLQDPPPKRQKGSVTLEFSL